MTSVVAGWMTTTIAECCDILDNKRKPINSSERLILQGHIPYYGANGIVGYINDFIFDEDLILIAEDGGNFGDFQTRPIAYKISGKSWVNNHAHVLRSRSSYCQDFIFYSLEHKDITTVLNGGTRAKLNKSELEKIEVFAPEKIAEQQKIAVILTAADDKLDLIARQISATQTLKQGLMQTLFTRGAGTPDAQGRWHPHTAFQDTELGRIPVGWSVEPLDALSNSITVGIATSTTEHYVKNGIPLIRNQNIKEDFLDMSDLLSISASFDESNKSKRVQGGDILTVRTGYPGVSCVVPEGLGYLQTFTTLITKPKHERVNAYFVSLYFNSPQGKKRMLHEAAGGAQQNINAGNLKKLLVPVPSLPEQKRIAAALELVSHKLHTLTTKQTHYQSLKRGLMQKLLTGQWRVRLASEVA